MKASTSRLSSTITLTLSLSHLRIPSHLPYVDRDTARSIKLRPIPPGSHKLKEHHEHLASIRDFLGHYRWGLAEDSVRGITWLELLASYEAHGLQLDTKPYTDPSTHHTAKT